MSDTPPVETPVKIKKERTPAQLETLRLAREKASIVRASNAELRRKQALIDHAAASEVKRAKKEEIEKQYAALQPKIEPEPTKDEEEGEEEVEYVYKKKPAAKKPRKRIVVVEKSSDSDSEVELEVPRPKVPRPVANEYREDYFRPPERSESYRRLYNKMFDIS